MIVIICAVYCRLSREDAQKSLESESIQNQKSLLVSYAVQRGWEIYKIYSDDDYSGTDSTRPEFNLMLADAENKRFNIILCKSQSRFTRDIEAVEKYLHNLFLQWGIRFVTVADNVDTEIKGTKKARQINGLINEWYLEDLSENIKTVLDNKRRNGQYIGSFAAYGYKKCDTDRNKLVIDAQAAGAVRKIFELYLNGFGKQAIADYLNNMNIPNPTEYKKLNGLCYKNGSAGGKASLWNKTTVGRILKNEIYTGDMVQGKRKKPSYKSKKTVDTPPEQWFRCKNTHKAIINKSTFELTQKLLNARTRTCRKSENHIFAGKVMCMACGGAMCKSGNGYSGGESSYLRCRLHTQDKTKCSAHSIRLDFLTDIISNKIREYIAKYYDVGGIKDCVGNIESCFVKSSCKKEAALLTKQLNSRYEALKLLYISKAENKLNDETFKQLGNQLSAEISLLKNRLSALQSEQAYELNSCYLYNTAVDIAGLKNINREIICLLIDSIEIGEKDKQKNEQTVKINWLL